MADNARVAQTPEEVEATKQYTEKDENRQLAFSKALELLRILCKDALEREMIAQRTFTRTEVVKKTTLSHRKALDLLETLQTFGYVDIMDANKTKFCFAFNADDRAAVHKAKIIQLTTLLGAAIETARDPGNGTLPRPGVEFEEMSFVVDPVTPRGNRDPFGCCY